MKRILAAVLVTAILAACSSTPTKEQDPASVEDRGAAGSQPGTKPPVTTGGPTTQPLDPKGVSGNPLKDPSNVLSKRSVYFELDSNVVRDEFKPLVSAHARYLQQNRNQKMTVQGLRFFSGPPPRRRRQADDDAAGRAKRSDRDRQFRRGKTQGERQ
jgi:peptidoglycan-associated lipoprotein